MGWMEHLSRSDAMKRDGQRRALRVWRGIDSETKAPERQPTAILARHGPTPYNGDNERYRGWLDVPLSDAGKKLTLQIAGKICQRFPAITMIYSSDLKRAAFLGAALGRLCDVEPIYSIDWRPWDIGVFSGTKVTGAVEELMPYMKDPLRPIPGGEALMDFLVRFTNAFRAALDDAAAHNKTIAIATHTRDIRAAMGWLAGSQDKQIKLLPTTQEDDPLKPGEFTVLSFANGRWGVEGTPYDPKVYARSRYAGGANG